MTGPCERCGSVDWIEDDGPAVCRPCLRRACAAVADPALLSPGMVGLLERDHGTVVVLGLEMSPDRRGLGADLRRAWRWTTSWPRTGDGSLWWGGTA